MYSSVLNDVSLLHLLIDLVLKHLCHCLDDTSMQHLLRGHGLWIWSLRSLAKYIMIRVLSWYHDLKPRESILDSCVTLLQIPHQQVVNKYT